MQRQTPALSRQRQRNRRADHAGSIGDKGNFIGGVCCSTHACQLVIAIRPDTFRSYLVGVLLLFRYCAAVLPFHGVALAIGRFSASFHYHRLFASRRYLLQ